MSLLEKIYDISPVFFQNLMVTISGYERNLGRYGKEYHKHKHFLQEFDTWSIEEKKSYQREELIKIVAYAKKHSKFYNNLYRDISLDESFGYKDFESLPIIDKESVRDSIEDIFTITKDFVEGHTGGTTGKSLVVRFTKKDMNRRMAMLDHFKERGGFINRRDRRATFNGKHIISPTQKGNKFWRYNHACRQMIYSSFHLAEDNLSYYVDSLNKFKPKSLDGFISSMCDVARYIEVNDIQLKFKPVAIFPTSETVTIESRKLLERVFGCKVYNQYASSEGAPFITECNDGHLHIEMASGVFERISKDSNEVLVTSFTTYGTPLIRYRIGDSVEAISEGDNLSCGIDSYIASDIHGRKSNYLLRPDGSKVIEANVANLFKNLPNTVVKAQVVQKRLDLLVINLKVDSKKYCNSYDSELMNEVKHKFGNNVEVVIKKVSEIPREKSGKFRFVVNCVSER